MNRLVWWFIFFLVLAFVTNLFEAIGGKVGGLIGLIAGIPAGYKAAKAVTEPLIKEQECRKREADILAAHEREVSARVAAEAARAAEETRVANLYNFRELAAAFDRAKPTSKQVDQVYLQEVVAVALGGGNVGRNEFERRDFEQVKARRVKEIRTEQLVCDVRVGAYFLDYDFESQRFPVWLQIYRGDGVEVGVLPRTPSPKHDPSKIEGFIPMETKQARSFRMMNPSVKTVSLIIRPVSGWNSDWMHDRGAHVRGELLGLQMLDANTGRPLVYPQT